MTVEVHGKPNYQKLAETWLGLLAARDGMSIVPGSVKVELKGEQDDEGKTGRNTGEASPLGQRRY